MDNNGGEFADLPPGWMRCDGSVIGHGSIWEGKRVPNLNGEKRFLRGGLDKDVLKLEEDQLQDHEHVFNDPGHSHIYDDAYIDDPDDNDHIGPDGADYKAWRWDAPHSKTSESHKTGITVTGVSNSASTSAPVNHNNEFK